MFDDMLNALENGKSRFAGNVRDSFGESICSEVYDKMIADIRQMDAANKAAKLREAEIQVLTLELRLML